MIMLPDDDALADASTSLLQQSASEDEMAPQQQAFQLESAPGDVTCAGVPGPATVVLSQEALSVFSVEQEATVRVLRLADVTAVFLRKTGRGAGPRSSSIGLGLLRFDDRQLEVDVEGGGEGEGEGEGDIESDNESVIESDIVFHAQPDDDCIRDDDADVELVVVSFPRAARPGPARRFQCCGCCGLASLCAACCCPCGGGGPEAGRELQQLVLRCSTSALVHHWEYAVSAAASGRAPTDLCIGARRDYMVVISTASGAGSADAVDSYERLVRPILELSRGTCTVVVTSAPGEAARMVAARPLAHMDGVVVLGDDAAVHEVVQGLKRNAEGAGPARLRVPIGVVPCGQGRGNNGLAAALHAARAVGAPGVVGAPGAGRGSQGLQGQRGDVEGAAVAIARGRTRAADLWRVTTMLPDGETLGEERFAALSLAWGLVADVDVEAEALRCLGGLRFTIGALKRVVGLREYEGTLSYLPCTERAAGENGVGATLGGQTEREEGDEEEEEEAIPLVSEPLPPSWRSVSGSFTLLWALNVTHSGQAQVAAPSLESGCLEVVVVESSISRAELVSGLRRIERGTHLELPAWEHLRARALRLEAPAGHAEIPGRLVVDGELLDHAVRRLQVQCMPSHALFFAP